MARAPRRSPNSPGFFEPQADPLDEAVIIDQEGIAGNLGEVLEKLSAYDQSSIKGVLFQKPKNGIGKFEWIEEVAPPFDMSSIMQELKERFGGGAFRLSIFAGGKVRKHIEFDIVREKVNLTVPVQKDNNDGMLTMFQMMNAQSQASADRQMQMMMTMQNQSREASQQNLTMMVTMMTAMMGNQGKPTDMIPLIAAMKEGSSSGGMKEMVETLVALKSITEPATPSGFDADNIVGSVLKIAGPVAGAVGRAVGNMRPQPRGAAADTGEAQIYEPNPGQLELPQAPQQHALPSPTENGGEPGLNRLLALIRPDVNYFFSRQHEAGLAADAVYAVIEAGLEQGAISEDDLNVMVSAYFSSPDWLAELAGHGIDLRSRPEWAQQFLMDLVAVHTDALQGDDHSGGQGGSGDDALANGEARAPRLESPEGATTGGQPDDDGI